MTREEVADLMKIVKSKQTKRIYGIKDKMNATDWVAYFKFKAASYDVSYIPSEFKDVAIVRKLMKSFNKDEIQTIVLAYLSGVNESHILTGRYDLDEIDRVFYAAQIVEKYQEY